ASRRIFGHFLRGPQPTFLAGYLILCVAGAVLPALPAGWAVWAALALWGTFAAAAVKVNRHVFWLVEEHRGPRVAAFLPILLLGGQFLALFALNLAPHLEVEWMGLGLVLVAIPVLLCADSIARVFQERTGGLVRPWPWSIAAPFVLGLSLCAAGMVLSAVEFPMPVALVPTAALAALLMGVAAYRTGYSALVWAMLGGIVLAYNFSPVFFREFAQMAVHHGAVAVRESRLPYAFYGLTYLPLLAAAVVAARMMHRRGRELFARPLRQFSAGLACLWLAVSLSHPKAVFPVGLAMTAVFAAQTAVFRDRRLVLLGILACLTATAGLPYFLEHVLGWALPPDIHLLT
ncbi:MAG: hypothetical protein ACREIV_16205, partial [Planctomycetaceae bacterium]